MPRRWPGVARGSDGGVPDQRQTFVGIALVDNKNARLPSNYVVRRESSARWACLTANR